MGRQFLMTDSRPYRILMFATGFAPYSFSENLVNSKLALAMQNRGWHIDVISAVDEGPVYSATWTDPWLKLKKNTYEITSSAQSSSFLFFKRCQDSFSMGHPLPYVRWARQAYQKGLVLHENKPYDIILSRSISCVSHLPALAFRRKIGVPWIANWNDPPGFLFPAPYQIDTNWFWKSIWSRYYRAVADTATFNTFPSERLAKYMQKHLGCFPVEKNRIIPHLMLDGYESSTKPKSDVFRLCHAGNLANERDPGPFLAALRRLIDTDGKGTTVEFEIIGVENDKLKQQILQMNLQDHVHCLGSMSYLDTMNRLAQATVPVLIEAPCEEGVFLPSKLADYVQVGRPILGVSPLNGTIADTFKKFGGGIAVDCTSIDSIYNGLNTMFDYWEKGVLNQVYSDTLLSEFAPDHIFNLHKALIIDHVKFTQQ